MDQSFGQFASTRRTILGSLALTASILEAARVSLIIGQPGLFFVAASCCDPVGLVNEERSENAPLPQGLCVLRSA
jgi:hypothetical protein